MTNASSNAPTANVQCAQCAAAVLRALNLMYGSSMISLAHPSSVSNPDALAASHPYPHPQKDSTQMYPSQGLTSHRSILSVKYRLH